MPHSVTPEPVQDVAMDDASQRSTTSEESDGPAPAVEAENKSVDGQANEHVSADMFDDDIDDQEFASSAPDSSNQIPSAPQHISEGFSDSNVMRAFYQRLFPFRQLFQWLNHSASPTNDFGNREFAFTLPNDAYLRYQSFPTADLLRKQCMQLLPSRFEIGPVYNSNPRDRKTLRSSTMFRPLSKELVFDIDMTDYDSIRTCCTGAKICNKCWQFITMAIKVVDVALREDFGFKHIMWVYSGRRGAHAWVCDKRARQMDDSKRRAVASYLELVRGGDKGGKKINARRPLHPHLQRSLNLLKPSFATDILDAQDPLSKPTLTASLLSSLPDPDLRSALEKKWSSSPDRSSLQKWKDIQDFAQNGQHSGKLTSDDINQAREDVVLEYAYPRLDAEVSKKLNHLLKSPFCVHPGTGRICVPLDVRTVADFEPEDVPRVTELLAEIDGYDREHGVSGVAGNGENAANGGGVDRKVHDYQKTRLEPYVEYFSRFVRDLLRDEAPIKREREDGAEAMEF